MVVEPIEAEEASPAELMAATLVSDEFQVTSDVTSWMAAFDSVPLAENCWVVPAAMVGFAGVTAMDTTVAEVRPVEPEIPAKVALIVLLPAATAVASPLALIVAAEVSDESQVARAVKSWVALFDKIPVALNCLLVPTMLVEFAGVTEMDATAAEVSVVEPEMLPEVAVMVVEPKATAVASPLVPWVSPMVATAVSDDFQVTEAVRSWAVLSEYIPNAENCAVVPGVIVPLAGVTVIETRVAEEDLPPPHPERARIIMSATKKHFAMLSSFHPRW